MNVDSDQPGARHNDMADKVSGAKVDAEVGLGLPGSPEPVVIEGSANPQAGARITISYCTQCKWLLRAAWMAQELLSTFETDIIEVTLRPRVGGLFRIEVDGELVWDRIRDGGFPDVKTMKRRIRDKAAPGRALGHVDRD